VSSNMRKRKAEEKEEGWETHKSAILDLYVNQKQPLRKVVIAMAAQGFVRTYVHILMMLHQSAYV
jgi:hypothetical protein